MHLDPEYVKTIVHKILDNDNDKFHYCILLNPLNNDLHIIDDSQHCDCNNSCIRNNKVFM